MCSRFCNILYLPSAWPASILHRFPSRLYPTSTIMPPHPPSLRAAQNRHTYVSNAVLPPLADHKSTSSIAKHVTRKINPSHCPFLAPGSVSRGANEACLRTWFPKHLPLTRSADRVGAERSPLFRPALLRDQKGRTNGARTGRQWGHQCCLLVPDVIYVLCTEAVVKSRAMDYLLLLLPFALTLRGPSGGHCVELHLFPSSSIFLSH